MVGGSPDGDTLAGAVPAGVDQICLGAALFHLLDELFCILGRMQLEERLTEAGGERRVGSVMPRSVPASFAVKPDRK